MNGNFFFAFSTPETWLSSWKLTGNEEMFFMVNDFSNDSPTRTLPKLMRPSYGKMLTSGLTPVPLRLTETIVWSENITTLSSYICWARGSNWITIGFVSPGLIVRIAFSTENPPNGVRDCKFNVSSIVPTFLIRISFVFRNATGTSPKSIISVFGMSVRFTVVVRTYKNSDFESVSVLSDALK